MGLHVNFTHPWFLFALVLFALLTFIPHFKVQKKYRRNRNRIVSLVLHILVSILSVLTLAGLSFSYNLKNDQNEILLLVDVTDSEEKVIDERDEFIQTVLNYGQYDGYRIGIVTFGFDQVYAVPFTTNIKSIYDKYLAAEQPDTSATDIAAALNYAKTLFTYPETAKIVLVSDLRETDEEANNVIRAISASGIKIDISYFDTTYKESDNQITGIDLPDTHITVNEDVQLGFTVKATGATELSAKLYDNGVLKNEELFTTVPGDNEFAMIYQFAEDGMHEIQITIDANNDTLAFNNTYTTYVNIQNFTNVLILETYAGQSTSLKTILTENDAYTVDVCNITTDSLPSTLDDLREYDQVILNNVSNADLTSDFVNILKLYVFEYGGGLFTTGGEDTSGKANAYSRTDLYGTVLQEMLPVEAINYTPPVGVVFIIDKSGSMTTKDGLTGKSYLEMAEDGAISALQVLTERDYVGVMTLETTYGMVLDMTPRTKEGKIIEAIRSIGTQAGGGTIFYDAIERAAQQLNALSAVAKRHIVIVSDGMPADGTGESGRKIFAELMQKLYEENGITTSIIMLGKDENSSAYETMFDAVDHAGGHVYGLTNASDISTAFRDDLSAPEIKEVNSGDFAPIVKNIFSSVITNVAYSTVRATQNMLLYNQSDAKDDASSQLLTLSGFYGVKQKNGAETLIAGDYEVPIYSQWKYGKGMVGSLMVDVYGSYSSNLLSSDNGKTLLRNIVKTLMPTENIRSNEITLKLDGENYFTNLSIYTNLEDGQKITGTITNLSSDIQESINISELPEETAEQLRTANMYMMSVVSADNNYSRATFVVRTAGVYEIVINKVDSVGTVIATNTIYRTFSYSDEYDIYIEALDPEALASAGRGSVIEDNEDPIEVFDGFVTSINKTLDPRILFMILILIFFLTDIAVRKFKFKWIHELIQEKNNRNKK